METGIAFLIGLIAGACLGDFMAGRKIKIATREWETGGGYQPIKPWPTPTATSPRPPAPKGCSGVPKLDKMTAAERAIGYIKIASLMEGQIGGKELSQKQRLLTKAETIIDAAGERIQITYTNQSPPPMPKR